MSSPDNSAAAPSARPGPRATGAAATGLPLLGPLAEARLTWWLRWRLLSNMARVALATSRLRLSIVILLTILLWIGLFELFAEGFQFLASTILDRTTQDAAVRAIFNLFFATLTVMLVISTGIILYGNLYHSEEVRFLLTLPLRAERVFLHKLQEAMLLASWGFLLLGSPMLLAYGVVADAGFAYYLLLGPFLLTFVIIPATAGAAVCLVLVRILPRLRWRYVGAAVAIVGLVLIRQFATGVEANMLTPAWFQEMLGRLRMSENRLFPSWWLSTGLLEATSAGWTRPAEWAALSQSMWFLALTLANGLALRQVVVALAGRWFRSTHAALHARRPARRRRRSAWLDHAALIAVRPLSPPLRLLIVKDLRLFRRDPVQWLQFLIFFGLLALYFLNIRRLSYDMNYAAWVHMISYMNVGVIGLILSTFTTRFVFPLISLEGRRFWILGLLPLERSTILWGKYVFACAGALVPCSLLVILSDRMLRVPQLVLGVHLVLCVGLCSGLAAIAVGLGAKMPNLKEDSPSRISAGFGGTLNLVISAAFISLIVLLTALPSQGYVRASHSQGVTVFYLDDRFAVRFGLGLCASVGLAVAATVVPLRLGSKAFRELEF